MNPHAKVILPDSVVSATDQAWDLVETLRRVNPLAAADLQAEMESDREFMAVTEIVRWQKAGETVTVQDALDWGIQAPDGHDAREVFLLKGQTPQGTIVPPSHVPVDPKVFEGMAIDLDADLEARK